jgi:hypothetical protein
MSVCRIVALSDLKTNPFLRFQSCQQQSAMRVLKCIGGKGAGLERFWMLPEERSSIILFPLQHTGIDPSKTNT